MFKSGAGGDRACGRDALSRALAFRRTGRAGKRAAQSGPRRFRLAQPRARRRSRRKRACAATDARFAVGPVTPLVVRGPTPVMSWTPTRIQPASEDTMARLIDLYHHTDVELARALEGRRDLGVLARAGDPPPWRRPKVGSRRRASRAGARLLRGCGGHGGEIPRARRRAAHRRARLQRLGHAYRRGRGLTAGSRRCSARSMARSRR